MSLAEIGVSPSFIEAARRYHKAIATEEDMPILQRADLRPIKGGYNNAVYAFRHNGRSYCLKFYKVDERQRARREWCALELLTSRGCFYPPRPFHYDADSNPPVVVMEFVDGRGLGNQPLNKAHLSALVDALQEMYAITPALASDPLGPVVGDAHGWIRFLRRGERDIEPSTLDVLAYEEHTLLRTWLQGTDPAILMESAPLVFSRGDPNLANCLWDGQRLRIVDFEYSGWNDRAFDLADLVEHIQSRRTPDEEWGWFVEQFGLSREERIRFQAAQRLAALFWMIKSWPKGVSELDSPERQRFASQLQRVQYLCQADSRFG